MGAADVVVDNDVGDWTSKVMKRKRRYFLESIKTSNEAKIQGFSPQIQFFSSKDRLWYLFLFLQRFVIHNSCAEDDAHLFIRALLLGTSKQCG